jgi:osmotically-inducible protein OsmY
MAHPYDDRYREGHRGEHGFGRDDRGFFERAGDEVRSWFGHDEAERRRRQDEERARRERMTSERGWSGGERWDRPERWRSESERWQSDQDRWRGDYGRADYDRPSRAWNEPGYGRWPDDDRSMPDERWSGTSEGSRDYPDRWRNENYWGPATWSQADRWRRENNAYGDRWSTYADRASRESHWGAWPREQQGSWQTQRRPGESRGFYEDSSGHTHQFTHRQMNHSGRGPKGYRRSDERIREEICDRLTDDWRVDATEVEVVVNNGQVTLGGMVHSREEKRKAEDLVESIPGVQDVHNNLRVSHWDESRGYDRSSGMTGGGMNSGGMNAGGTAANTAHTPQSNTTNPRR